MRAGNARFQQQSRAYEMQSGCVFITLLGADSKGYASLPILNIRAAP
jgi:hypothetical protein